MASTDLSSVQDEQVPHSDLRLVMIGKTGTGKSKTGNTILDADLFRSVAEASSVTGKCQLGRSSRWGRHIQVVDTPGLFDTGLTQDQVADEIRKCVAISAPGPHAIILVTSIGRFTEEDCRTVSLFKEIFGDEMLNFLIVLFTRRDDLDDEGRTLEDYVDNAPPGLSRLLQQCGHRHVAFNNKASPKKKRDQVKELLELVDLVICQNDGGHYTTAMFQAAELIMQQRMEELRRQHEQERSRLTRTLSETEEDHQNKMLDFQENTLQMSGKMADLERRMMAASRKEADRLQQELSRLRQEMTAKEETYKAQIECMKAEITKQKATLARGPPNFRQVVRQEVIQENPGFLQTLARGLQCAFGTLMTAIASRFGIGLRR